MSFLIFDPLLLEKIREHRLEAYKRDPGESAINEETWVIWRAGVPVKAISAETLTKEEAFRKYFEQLEAK